MKFNSLNIKKNLILFSIFIFIFWINQKVNAEEIKLNELDKRLEKISEISDKTFDFVSSKGFFATDTEEKKENLVRTPCTFFQLFSPDIKVRNSQIRENLPTFF